MVNFRVGDQAQPARSASSYLGSFPVMEAAPNDQLDFTVFWGDSYMAAIEFSEPIRAQVLTVYGNATQPHSPHRGDQLALYRRGELRTVWRDRDQIEANFANRLIVNSD
jgi:acyl-homoserine-lactone acylase